MKQANAISLVVIGSTLVLLGAATYFYLNSCLYQDNIDIDLSDEDDFDYV